MLKLETQRKIDRAVVESSTPSAKRGDELSTSVVPLGPTTVPSTRHRPVIAAAAYVATVAQEMFRDGLTTLGHRLAGLVGRSPRLGAPLSKVPRDLTGKVCVVTGANSGIGFATAKQLGTLGADVVLVCRNPDKAAAAKTQLLEAVPDGRFTIVLGDLGSGSAARDLGDRLRLQYPRIDVLVNNAGILATEPGVTEDGEDRSRQVNHLGPADLTLSLLPSLERAGGRVVQVSSGMHHRGSLDANDRFSIVRSYADAKLESLTFAAALKNRLADRGVSIQAVHPGAVKTNIASGKTVAQRLLSAGMAMASPFLRRPEQGAETVAWLAAAPEGPASGELYWYDRAVVDAHPTVTDEAAQKRVFEETLAILGRSEGSI